MSENTTKLYAKWIYCCKEICAESYNGRCNIHVPENKEKEYPKDGLCYDPHYEIYDEEADRLGAYEKEATNV